MASSSTTSASSLSGYRGRCRYKSGRCPNERTLKYNGEQVHSLCEEHRIRHNRNQRRADTKRRKDRVHQKPAAAIEPRWPVLHDASPARKASPPDATWMAVTEWTWDVLNDDEALPPWSNEDIQLLLECVVDAPSSPFEML
ncbi:hypothetical protein SPRG_12921 [Saprolegnia parasitica CBS 223.65]|uniref:Uncharacterized protein n=1 Tax=Saprolegnia parasitica (strain CBS 223.65) TaxID=695850 RepID=A0A067BWD2_SAPPC|nr:hypothetical protein SPRG_12921 [Saprolegnia parasitica CBS 223.65]KDO21140.1 hypothetical protein SPRG_12921 [Saprolegnia parasitica CBS 223.65]|eukprot:XP_012208139.1 hypothetical protein SPRG_12921 [Saprolegnia parasitica CBS 223.65]